MHTGLSPEWDRGFDEAFTDLVCRDADFIHTSFAALTRKSWPTPRDPRDPRDPRQGTHGTHGTLGEARPERHTGAAG